MCCTVFCFCEPCRFQTARKSPLPCPSVRPFLPDVAGTPFLQAKLKLGAFPVGYRWLLCRASVSMYVHVCRARDFARQGYYNSQNNKRRGKMAYCWKLIQARQSVLTCSMFWYCIDEISCQSWDSYINICTQPLSEIRNRTATFRWIPFEAQLH